MAGWAAALGAPRVMVKFRAMKVLAPCRSRCGRNRSGELGMAGGGAGGHERGIEPIELAAGGQARQGVV